MVVAVGGGSPTLLEDWSPDEGPRQLAARGREALEELRGQLLQQMHLPGAPSAAPALRRVEQALALVPREVDRPWTWQPSARRQRRRGRAT